jgi:hypothetical protein
MSKVSDPAQDDVQDGRCQQSTDPLYPQPSFHQHALPRFRQKGEDTRNQRDTHHYCLPPFRRILVPDRSSGLIGEDTPQVNPLTARLKSSTLRCGVHVVSA